MTPAPRHVALVGLMGSGKSAVGRRLARRLGCAFVDTDELVVLTAGRSINEIFATDGEAAFRALERQAVADACASPEPAVISCGGGVVLDAENRRQLRAHAQVVWLDASVDTLAKRVGDGATRPLLAADPRATLARLATLREPAYEAAAHVRITTDHVALDDVVALVARQLDGRAGRDTITVELGDRAYPIRIGAGVRDEAAEPLAARGVRRALVVVQEATQEHARPVVQALEAAEIVVTTSTMADGEHAKSLATVEELCRAATRAGVLRGDAFVGVGGGVVGDTVGFAAAVHYRGVAVVHVPTTLLAMVDSAVGGKTAVNIPEGKNLVGSFHQPIAVLADPEVLTTLPDREYRCGLGEVVKYALMGDAELLALCGDQRDALVARDPAVLRAAIARSAAIKAGFVAADEFETKGRRAHLNYGHTLAHAIETVADHALAHGEAVAVGLVFAGALAGALERLQPDAVARHHDLVAGLGLPTRVPEGLAAGDLLAVMRRDKKAAGGLTFVLDGPNGLERVDDPPVPALDAAFAAVGVRPSSGGA